MFPISLRLSGGLDQPGFGFLWFLHASIEKTLSSFLSFCSIWCDSTRATPRMRIQLINVQYLRPREKVCTTLSHPHFTENQLADPKKESRYHLHSPTYGKSNSGKDG